MIRYAFAILTFVVLIGQPVLAGGLEHVQERVDAEGADRLDVVMEFGAGELTIRGRDMSEAAVVEIDFNPKRIDYMIDYRLRGSTGQLELESIFRNRKSIDTDDNIWDVTFSRRYPMSLDIEIGASEAELDLTGIPIEEMSLEIGAAAGTIVFDELNPVRMVSMDIEAGAASLECIGLGNANCEEFSFEGGAGSFELDFRGDFEGEMQISIEIGLGSVDIKLPRDVPVRIEAETDGWLSSIDFHGGDLEEVDDDEFESPDFDHADRRIILSLEIGMGSADIYFKR
jgi:hypothetical protein